MTIALTTGGSVQGGLTTMSLCQITMLVFTIHITLWTTTDTKVVRAEEEEEALHLQHPGTQLITVIFGLI